MFHLLKDASRNLGRRHLLATSLYPGIAVLCFHDLVRHEIEVALHNVLIELAADQSLGGKDGVMGIRNGLPLCGLADKHLSIVTESHDGRRCTIAFRVFNYLGFPTIHHCHAGIRGTQIDSNYACHL